MEIVMVEDVWKGREKLRFQNEIGKEGKQESYINSCRKRGSPQSASDASNASP